MGIVVHVVDRTVHSDAERFKSRSTRTAGDIVISLGSLCNGVVAAIQDVRRATGAGTIDAMIVYGHGMAGVQGVSMGRDGEAIDQMAAITLESLAEPAFAAQLQALGPHFTSRGVIVLQGCNVAEGEVGKSLLRKLSKLVGVPVKGSTWFQIVGRSDLAGDIVTAFPGGTLRNQSLLGLINMGGLPVTEAVLLLGHEFHDRLVRRFRPGEG